MERVKGIEPSYRFCSEEARGGRIERPVKFILARKEKEFALATGACNGRSRELRRSSRDEAAFVQNYGAAREERFPNQVGDVVYPPGALIRFPELFHRQRGEPPEAPRRGR